MWMCCVFTPDIVFKLVLVPPKGSELTWQTSMWYSCIVLLIHVNETMYLYGNLPFFKIHVNHFLAQDDSPGTKVILKEETARTGSILKAGLHLGPDCGLWAICPVSMETTYKLENQTPWMEGPQGSYLDSLSPKRIPYLSVWPNRIINFIMLIGVWPQAYW